MSCPSGFNPDFSGCYHCPFWRIKQDELEANSELIKKELNTAMNTLKSTTSFLVQLHKQSDLDAAGEVNPALKTDLITPSKQLKKEIIDVSKIQQIYNLLRKQNAEWRDRSNRSMNKSSKNSLLSSIIVLIQAV